MKISPDAFKIYQITYVVELFAAEDRLRLTLEKVPDKAVEKSALPTLFGQVDVEGAIILGDAHFTVAESAEMENFFGQAHAVWTKVMVESIFEKCESWKVWIGYLILTNGKT